MRAVAGPANAVASNETPPVVDPVIAALTRCWPDAGPSVHDVDAEASPSVVTSATLTAPPPSSTVNVTLAPGTEAPPASSERTTRGSARASPTVPVWAKPETADTRVATC